MPHLKSVLGMAATTVALAAGLVCLADYFLAEPGLDEAGQTLTGWVAILLAASMLLGLANVAQAHSRRLLARSDHWPFSLVLLLTAAVMLALGLRPDVEGPNEPALSWAYRYVLSPLGATVFSLLAFFVASAAVRTLRLRTGESRVVLAGALIVLLGQVPLGYQLWAGMPVLQEWLLQVPVAGAFRGILIGVGLGTLATGLRILLGQDRPYTGEPPK